MDIAIASIVCLGTGYLAYQFIPAITAIRKQFRGKDESKQEDNSRAIVFQRLLGVFVYGFIPMLIITTTGNEFSTFGFNGQHGIFTIIAGSAIGVLLVLLNFFHGKQPETLAIYPQIRKSEWSYSLLLLSAISWLAYLFAYEFIFRGFLLFSLAHDYGNELAVAINVTLYALVHVTKGWKEAIGAIPLGIVFCGICLYTGNFYAAFIAHAMLALSNEWFSLARHPNMHLTRKRN